MSAPRATKGTSLKELTLRGIIIGGIITLVFTAANVYLGLKVGLTFATSIPAAVISMAVLRFWGDHTVQENNIVQTIASAALYFLNALKAISVDISGVVYAGIVVAFGGKADPLAIMPEGFEGRTAGSEIECILLDVSEDVAI